MTTTIDAVAETETGTALAVIRTALPTILAADQNDILGKLAAKVASHRSDISTAKGRDAIRSLAAEIASSKVTLVKLGKSLTEDWRAKTKAVNAECNVIEERMDALKEQVRRPLTDFENAEKARVAGHEAALAELASFGVIPDAWPSEHIACRIDELETSDLHNRVWQEFRARASDVLAGVLDKLRSAHTTAIQRETEAAELARLRAEQAERDRLAAIEAQRVREEQIRAEAAETAKREAEAKAAREAEAAAQTAQRAKEEAAAALAEAERRAEQERETARQVAERAETARVEAHQAALDAMRKLAAPLERPDPAAVIDAKLAQLDDVHAREWEEFKPQADAAYIEHQAALQDARVESVRLAEEAERRRRAADEAAEAARQAAAVEAERARAAEVKRVEDAAAAKRAENVAHRKQVNGEVLADILAAMEPVMLSVAGGAVGPAETIAKAIITAIARGAVRHVVVQY